jgi:hypothetical protein
MDDSDKRRAPRKRTLKGALIIFNGRTSTLSATLRDISDTGARLRVSKDVAMPDTFDLAIDSDGLEVPCTLAWRRGEEVGVRFTGPIVKVPPKRAQVVTALKSTAPSSTGSLLRRKPIT